MNQSDAALSPNRTEPQTRPAWSRFVILFAVFLCAACGLVYELALVTVGSYLLGNTIVQASIVLAVMVFAMGVGAFAAKQLTRRPAIAFAVVEALLGTVGGLSVLGLYLAFAYLNTYTAALVGTAFVIGALIGAEIPLLMEILQRIRSQRASSAVSDIFAVDYVGGLLGGLAFPFLILPLLGLSRGVIVVGAVNAVTGIAVILWLYRATISRRTTTLLVTLLVVVLAVLTAAWVGGPQLEIDGRQRLYRDPVIAAQRTQIQDIVLTENPRTKDTRLYLNGGLQFSSRDEYRYHEALVHPAMSGAKANVLILGGGDGLAAREVLKYPEVAAVTLVDLDPAVVTLARTNPVLSALNAGSLTDPRLRYIAGDAFSWLRETPSGDGYDVIIIDLPDPSDVSTAKLYTVEFYGLVRRQLAPGARIVVQAGSPYFAPESFWGIGQSLTDAELSATGYQASVPSFGDWGFFLAHADLGQPAVRLPDDAPPVRYFSAEVARTATVFPPDRDRTSVGQPESSTLLRPRVIEQQQRGWEGY